MRNILIRLGCAAVISLGLTYAFADYTATQGVGTNFASIIIGGVHHAAMIVCDATLGEARCGAVTATGGQIVDVATSSNQLHIDLTAAGPCLNATTATTNSYTTGQTNPLNCDLHGNLYATQSSQYPSGAVALTASATGTTAATTATLAGAVGKTTYICGYSIRANATAAATVTNTITGVITATLSSIMWVAPLASGIGVDEQIFSPCIPASATNTGIAIVSGAPGTGGTVSSKGWGYQL